MGETRLMNHSAKFVRRMTGGPVPQADSDAREKPASLAPKDRQIHD